MKTEYLYGIIGLLGGIVLTVVFANNAVNTDNQRMMGMMGMRQMNQQQAKSEGMMQMHDSMMDDESMTMSGMVDSLQGKTGDDFDKTFISEMIDHHQGAIDMAKLAKEKALHREIKDMADDIISAQTKEIDKMRQWQKDWSY